jgi:hypothetical protein
MALPNARRTSSGNVRRASRAAGWNFASFTRPSVPDLRPSGNYLATASRNSGISLSRGAKMRRRATKRAPSPRHAHPENSMNDGLWPDTCAVFNSRRLH